MKSSINIDLPLFPTVYIYWCSITQPHWSAQRHHSLAGAELLLSLWRVRVCISGPRSQSRQRWALETQAEIETLRERLEKISSITASLPE